MSAALLSWRAVPGSFIFMFHCNKRKKIIQRKLINSVNNLPLEASFNQVILKYVFCYKTITLYNCSQPAHNVRC